MNDDEQQYEFDLDKLTLGDIAFLASLDANSVGNEHNVRRMFMLLDHTMTNSDDIYLDEMPKVLAQFNQALMTRSQTDLRFSSFLDNLERGEIDDSPDRS